MRSATGKPNCQLDRYPMPCWARITCRSYIRINARGGTTVPMQEVCEAELEDFDFAVDGSLSPNVEHSLDADDTQFSLIKISGILSDLMQITGRFVGM